MSVSLKTIAQELGVSVSTVSRVVNGKDRVDGNTRTRVEAALKAHDYQPTQMARTLRGKSSRTFGVLVSDISNLLFSRLIKGVEQAAMDRGYDVIVVNTDGDPGRVKRGVSLLLDKQVSGIIMASGGFDQQVEKKVREQGIPLVFIDTTPVRAGNFSSVSIDNVLAAEELTKLLIENGHSKIAVLAGPQNESTSIGRLRGFQKALEANGIQIPGHWIVKGEFGVEAGMAAAQTLLSERMRPTAVIAVSNSLAYGAMHALRRHGYQVPADISLASFDVIDDSYLIQPVFTTVNQPVLQYGTEAVRLCLRQRSQTAKAPYEQMVLPHRLIKGETVGPVAEESGCR